MPNIQGLPEHLQSAPGVEMNSPPAQYMQQTTALIMDAVATLKVDEKGALVWLASKKGEQVGVNLALVSRVNDSFQIVGWIGKEFGQPIAAGIAGRVSW